MAFCPNCGKDVTMAGAYCPFCGAPLKLGLPGLPFSPTEQPLSPQPAPVPPAAIQPHRHLHYQVVLVALLLVILVLSALLAEAVLLPHFTTSSVSRNPYQITSMSHSRVWSGFIIYGNGSTIVDVMGKWTVPKVNCTLSSTSYLSAVWVGIDGARGTSNTVEQTGTIQRCRQGSATADYIAFIEWYPEPPLALSTLLGAYQILPGDTVSAEVNWDGAKFVATINDLTLGWSYSETNSTIGATASRSSAEWIVEAPVTLDTHEVTPLANFGKVFFSSCSVTRGTTTGPMGDFPLDQVTMIDSNSAVKALPVLPLFNDGTGFSVWWMSAGP